MGKSRERMGQIDPGASWSGTQNRTPTAMVRPHGRRLGFGGGVTGSAAPSYGPRPALPAEIVSRIGTFGKVLANNA